LGKRAYYYHHHHHHHHHHTSPACVMTETTSPPLREQTRYPLTSNDFQTKTDLAFDSGDRYHVSQDG
jgi:hypothetical protein